MVYFFMDSRNPAPNEFSLSDQSIQHKMVDKETVPDGLCLLLAIVAPTLCITLAQIATSKRNRVQLLNISLLGLFTAFTLNGALTNIWKVWLARPRPDFLSRCMPGPGTPLDVMVNMDVCTNNNMHVLMDGYKSLPSGHSSTSFVGLTYFSLWLGGQLKAFRQGTPGYIAVVCFLPLLLATFIAISRVRDYRHRYSDVVCGGVLGATIAIYQYFRFFPMITSHRANEPYAILDRDYEELDPMV